MVSPYSFVKESALGNSMLKRLASNPALRDLERTTVVNPRPAIEEALARSTRMGRPRAGAPGTQPNFYHSVEDGSVPWNLSVSSESQGGFRIPTKILRNRAMNPTSEVKGGLPSYRDLIDRVYARPSSFDPPKVGSALMQFMHEFTKLASLF